MNIVRSIMISSCELPLSFWGDTAECVAYIRIRSSTKANAGGRSPLELLTRTAHDLSDIVVFGSPCTVHRDTRNKSIGERGERGVITGKSDEVKRYRSNIPRSKTVVVTQHVRNVKTLKKEQNAHLRRVHLAYKTEAEEIFGVKTSDKQLEAVSVQKLKGHGQKTAWTCDIHRTRSVCRKDAETNVRHDSKRIGEARNVLNSVREPDPKNYVEVMRSELKEKWQIAMKEELEALEDNELWAVEVPPHKSHVLHTKWVFKTKTDGDGSIERFKAPLVACDNEQVFGVDYGLTFAAVMELSTVKVLLILALRWGVPARHGDIPNAYVKEGKEQQLEIFLAIPQGMIVVESVLNKLGVDTKDKLALRLKKSLYGLKQAGRLWSQLQHANLVDAGFTRCLTDMCLYLKHQDSETTIVGVYVDDLLVTVSKIILVREFFDEMRSLSIKDLGQVSKFLGMRVALNDGRYLLDQEAAFEGVLDQHGVMNAKGVRSPIGEENNDTEDDPVFLTVQSSTKNEPTMRDFQSLVGSLLWLARCTRPDISFAVHKATRRTHRPTTNDWKLAKRIVRYLKGTKSMKFEMRITDKNPKGFSTASWSDSDFAADK
uniref:PREDICTED: copia proteinlike putative n=1 Tax=Albugo laibachii Nc14 TaxID=890382 RepID=F0WTA5_9STRA|nr:PREDICTED: copia proteinlike putative [Albugo laibachii Nc14]|eukprot:CCA24594.1 PREDICTED: copia proteinlike putative [Albugo laibachii Nc14]